MSNYYTEKIKLTIIYLIEEGESSMREIARVCNVSVSFVDNVKNDYEWLCSNEKEKSSC